MPIPFFYLIKKAVSSYTGYKEGRMKEDDLAVRRKSKEIAEKARVRLRHILDMVSERGGVQELKAVRGALDELDVLLNEIELLEVGRRYGFFARERGISLESLKKLVEYDYSLIGKISDVEEVCRRIEDILLGGGELDLPLEFGKLRQYLTDIRADYRERIDYLKRLG